MWPEELDPRDSQQIEKGDQATVLCHREGVRGHTQFPHGPEVGCEITAGSLLILKTVSLTICIDHGLPH